MTQSVVFTRSLLGSFMAALGLLLISANPTMGVDRARPASTDARAAAAPDGLGKSTNAKTGVPAGSRIGDASGDRFGDGGNVTWPCDECEKNRPRARKVDYDCYLPRRKPAATDDLSAVYATRCDRGPSD